MKATKTLLLAIAIGIEKVAPHADKFMLLHLAEAYKDLWNLLCRLEPQ